MIQVPEDEYAKMTAQAARCHSADQRLMWLSVAIISTLQLAGIEIDDTIPCDHSEVRSALAKLIAERDAMAKLSAGGGYFDGPEDYIAACKLRDRILGLEAANV